MKNKIKNIAIIAAKKAGKELLRRYQNFNRGNVKLKAHHEILTQADLASEKIILSEIKKYFSSHRILSEEEGLTAVSGKRSDYLWVVDPLDGTTNFSMHNPIWCVSIGIACREEIFLGVIYSPFLNELYVAEKGKGAFCNGKKIKVSRQTKKALHAFCHGRQEKNIKKALAYFTRQKLHAIDCRQLGSAALELAYVASGRIESIMIPGANSWDVAAGVLMVKEAGGTITDFSGQEWNLKSKDMLASNGKVHKEVLKAINY